MCRLKDCLGDGKKSAVVMKSFVQYYINSGKVAPC